MAFGRAYGDSDFQPRAITEFRRAIEENPRLPGAHYLLAAVLLATGDDESHVADAETELKKELVISPHDSMSYAALGKIAATRHNYPEAETYLKKAISLGSQSPDAYLYLGQMYFATNRFRGSRNRSSPMHPSDDRCFAESIPGPEGALSSRQNPRRRKASRMQRTTEMKISRDLANKTLAQDKSKLAGLMDSSGSPDVRGADVRSQDVQAPAAEAGKATPPLPQRRIRRLCTKSNH